MVPKKQRHRATRVVDYRPDTKPSQRIYVTAARYNDGLIIKDAWEVRLGTPDGEIIVEISQLPMVDAACALSKRGVTGRLELWEPDGRIPRMRADIDLLVEAHRIRRRQYEKDHDT